MGQFLIKLALSLLDCWVCVLGVCFEGTGVQPLVHGEGETVTSCQSVCVAVGVCRVFIFKAPAQGQAHYGANQRAPKGRSTSLSRLKCYLMMTLLLAEEKESMAQWDSVVILPSKLLQDLLHSCSRGWRGRVEDMCYEIRRAETGGLD
jgi:hypothetical protein